MRATPDSNGAPRADSLADPRSPPPAPSRVAGEHRRHVLVAIVLNKPGAQPGVESHARAEPQYRIARGRPRRSADVSRMTITLHGDDVAVEQAAKQLYRLIDVLEASDVSASEHEDRARARAREGQGRTEGARACAEDHPHGRVVARSRHQPAPQPLVVLARSTGTELRDRRVRVRSSRPTASRSSVRARIHRDRPGETDPSRRRSSDPSARYVLRQGPPTRLPWPGRRSRSSATARSGHALAPQPPTSPGSTWSSSGSRRDRRAAPFAADAGLTPSWTSRTPSEGPPDVIIVARARHPPRRTSTTPRSPRTCGPGTS